jgi:DNA-binding transcriptional regulator LsrR (DeoR family)
MREIYVYYRVAQADAAAAAGRVRSMQAGLCASHPGLQARLLRRPVVATDLQTWMEVYSIAGGVGEALQQEIESAASSLLDVIQGPRHCEVFEAFPFPSDR